MYEKALLTPPPHPPSPKKAVHVVLSDNSIKLRKVVPIFTALNKLVLREPILLFIFQLFNSWEQTRLGCNFNETGTLPFEPTPFSEFQILILPCLQLACESQHELTSFLLTFDAAAVVTAVTTPVK